ncbi:Cyclochlorotine biosynthesis protein R [Colletotrichum sp. SAR 10_99]|nr:Cyclochlorotine biosynthesis protein R [Colletotrichum sp. SAR 10_96]KAJ5018797.1 Cyclochlorotine biosynthesis protein R [Colletotrichum sp. SAR 10_99]
MGSGKPESSSYKLLSDDESSVDNGHVCGRCETSISEDRPSRSFSTLKLILAFVFCQIPILLLSFAVFRYILRSNERTSETYHKDDYTGIVTVDDAWAERNHLPPTVKYPHDPQLRVYQVNVFHSLHCLYRIRNRLISNVPMEKWPRNDIHTMHCVDHLREEIMCNVDVSMSGSNEFVAFNNHNHDRKCRDLAAVQRWAQEHTWLGYKDYLEGVIGYDANEAERVNMALAGKGQWNKANSTHNKETGKIEAWFEDHEISSGH